MIFVSEGFKNWDSTKRLISDIPPGGANTILYIDLSEFCYILNGCLIKYWQLVKKKD